MIEIAPAGPGRNLQLKREHGDARDAARCVPGLAWL